MSKKQKEPFKVRFIQCLIVRLIKWARKISPPIVKNNELFLTDLAPKAHKTNTGTYREAIKWALDNSDVFNIAITGPYGSGKSSVLKAFEEENPNYKFLKISLASFKDEEELTEEVIKHSKSLNETEQKELQQLNTTKSEKETSAFIQKSKQEQHHLIELSILQQIFYRETSKTLPQSKFKRIKKIDKWGTRFLSFSVLVWLASLYYLFNKNFRENLYSWDHMSFGLEATIYILCLLIFVYGSIRILIEAVKFLYNAKFSKLNLTGAGIELNYDVDKSILNDHLNEILYFFEATDYDVVVVEDLDRFNDPDIFIKLREINMLINNAKQVARRIRFIYALKDEMFVDGKRTKFFDAIIPILPVVNYSNSLDLFLPKFTTAGIGADISKKFLYDITLYINDMRILNNIFNEFMMYKKVLKKDGAELEKLLGMVVYKNMYPKDFADLHNHEGIIYKVMNAKSNIVASLLGDKRTEIKAIESQIKIIQTETINTIEELKAVYIQGFITLCTKNLTAFRFKTKRISLKDVFQEENFDVLKNSTNIEYYYWLNSAESYTVENISFKTVEQHVNNKYSFDKRVESIESKSNGQLKTLEKRLTMLNRELANLSTRNYKDLLVKNRFALDQLDKEFINKELLVYLVRGGYINEMYETYMSYFYARSLTSTDMDFLKHVRNLEGQPFTYQLNNIEELLHRLEPEDFKMEEVLNFNLIDYLFKNSGRHKEHLKILFDQLANESKASLNFMYEYLDTQKYFDRYITSLIPKWSGMWEHIVISKRYTDSKMKKILKTIITRAELAEMDTLNGDQLFENYIASQEDLLTYIDEPEFEDKLLDVIKHFNIKFTSLSAQEASSPIFEIVYNESYYAINAHMIAVMLETKAGSPPLTAKEIDEANYTSILKSKATDLIKYVQLNLSHYIDEVMNVMPHNSIESEDTIANLLNEKEKLSTVQKELIIKKQEAKITDLNIVDLQNWTLLLENNKIAPNWSNLISYYTQFPVINEQFANYLNATENYSQLSKEMIIPTSGNAQGIPEKLALEIIADGNIKFESFKEVIKSNPFKYDNQDIFEGILKEKIELMIEKGNIPLSVYNFNELKEALPSSQIKLIEKNINAYLKTKEEFPLDSKDYGSLIQSAKVSEKNKIRIAEFISADDLKLMKNSADIISSLFLKNGHQNRPYDKISSILQHGPTSNSLSLFAMHINDFSVEENRDILALLGGKFNDINNKKKNPTFDQNPINREILEALKSKRIIVNFRPYKDSLKVYYTEKN